MESYKCIVVSFQVPYFSQHKCVYVIVSTECAFQD